MVLGGLTKPTAVRFSPDGRIFVAEKSGIIKVFENLSDSSPTVFADLRTSVHNYWDRGLLSMALDPGFPARPYVYVLYTYDGSIGGLAPAWGVPGVTSDGCPDPPGGTTLGCVVSGRVSRLQAAGNVMTGPETVLVHDWFQQFPGHSIGDLLFGPDGELYVSGGEGASFQFVDYGQVENPGGDPPVVAGALQTAPTAQGGSLRSQDLETPNDSTTLDGTVIRINPANGAALSDNPLYGRSDPNARRIVAYGFRNPFRLAMRPGTRELWVGDVGWSTYEEINVIPDPRAAPVRNFGWPCFEGNARQSGWDAAGLDMCEALYARAGATTAPFFSYKEGIAVAAGETCPNTSSSITGLAFYTGASYPTRYKGALFFADYTRRCVWVMFADAGGRPDPATRATFVQSAEYPVDLQIGPNGDLFYVNFSGGNIHRIRYSPADRAPQAVIQASPTSGAPPLTVKFDGSQSSDPEGSPVTYSWDLNADGTFGDSIAAAPTYTYGAAGTYRAGLRVQDGGGLTGSASVTISVGNTPPSAIIDTPSSTLRWRVGQSIGFSGRGVDAQQASLPASALSWDLIMNHCSTPASCHEHPIQSYQGTASGTFVAPDHRVPILPGAAADGDRCGWPGVRHDTPARSADRHCLAAVQPVGRPDWLRRRDTRHSRGANCHRRLRDFVERSGSAGHPGLVVLVRHLVRWRHADAYRRGSRRADDVHGDVQAGRRESGRSRADRVRRPGETRNLACGQRSVRGRWRASRTPGRPRTQGRHRGRIAE